MTAPRLAILSDLHLEFDRAEPGARRLLKGRRRLDPTPVDDDGHPLYGPRLDALRDADLILAVGDIDVRTWPVPWLEAAGRYAGCPVVFVPGNHEFYGRPVENALEDLRAGCAATDGRVTLLDDARLDLEIGGRRVAVLGCTLWTDHHLFGADRVRAVRARCDAGMTDHRVMRRARGRMRWTPEAVALTHARSRAWLAEALPAARREADTVVVATHHAPSLRSVPEWHRRDLLSAAYASDLEALMAGPDAPDLWAHGHIHWPVDYTCGRTRVASAPRGYLGEPGEATWRPHLIDLPPAAHTDPPPD
ncbi:metallophosphoesterase [Roseospira navarrensis]|nr:metallophosphoesterase [Roseospira navarrensis]